MPFAKCMGVNDVYQAGIVAWGNLIFARLMNEEV
jgi:hypothetical protein